jgi:uncharacterized membrane protein
MDTKDPLAVALAALEMCEALILALVEKDILSQDDAVRVLENAACAKQAVAEQEGSGAHAKAAGMVAEVMCSVEALKR